MRKGRVAWTGRLPSPAERLVVFRESGLCSSAYSIVPTRRSLTFDISSFDRTDSDPLAYLSFTFQEVFQQDSKVLWELCHCHLRFSQQPMYPCQADGRFEGVFGKDVTFITSNFQRGKKCKDW